MKLSVAVTPRESQFAPIPFRGSVLEGVKSSAELGYEGVELHICSSEDIDIPALDQALEETGIEVSSIGSGMLYGDLGLSLSSEKEDVRDQAVEKLKDLVDFSSRYDAQLIIGLVRGIVEEGGDRNEALQRLEDSLGYCCDYGSQKDVILTLEAINRYETNIFTGAKETAEFIRNMGKDNLKLHLDTFHMNIEEPNLVESIRATEDILSHVHFADSNRYSPGRGHIDFEAIIQTLEEVNFSGYGAVEVLPEPDGYTAARNSFDHLNSIL